MNAPLFLPGPAISVAQHFDQQVRTDPDQPNHKGWGQFLSAEAQAGQVGLNGTCAGVVVKSVAAPATQLDAGVTAFLADLWNDRNHARWPRYFGQTYRLALFFLACSLSSDSVLISIRDAVKSELLGRQDSTGAWPNFASASGTSEGGGRVDTSAWVLTCLVLSKNNQADVRAARTKAVVYLSALRQRSQIDPLVCAAIALDGSSADDARWKHHFKQLLRTRRPTPEALVYFSEYVNPASRRIERDYYCVPEFFVYATVASSGVIHTFSGYRGYDLTRNFLQQLVSLPTPTVKSTAGNYPATLDQALLVLAFSIFDQNAGKTEFFRWWFWQPLAWAKESAVTRVILPLILVIISAVAAQNPQTLAWAAGWLAHTSDNFVSKFITGHASAVQFAAIAYATVFGQPSISSIFNYVRSRWQG